MGGGSLQALLAGPADGLLLFEADLPPGATEHAIQIEMCPGGLPVVRLDVEAGVDAAMDHLLELGHTRIGHVASSFDAPTFDLPARPDRATARRRRHRRCRRRSRSRARPRAAGPLLEQDVTAVFCDDDILAGGVYLAARERGIAIPRDLSVVGFDDLDFARVLAPPLTTVAADAEGLGAAAFEALARDLAGETAAAEQVLPVALRVRESTAPPPPVSVTTKLMPMTNAWRRIDRNSAIDSARARLVVPRSRRAVAQTPSATAVVLLVAGKRPRTPRFWHARRPQPTAPARAARRAHHRRPARRHASVRRPRLRDDRHRRSRPPGSPRTRRRPLIRRIDSSHERIRTSSTTHCRASRTGTRRSDFLRCER